MDIIKKLTEIPKVGDDVFVLPFDEAINAEINNHPGIYGAMKWGYNTKVVSVSVFPSYTAIKVKDSPFSYIDKWMRKI